MASGSDRDSDGGVGEEYQDPMLTSGSPDSDGGVGDEYDHYYPMLTSGSPHVSDEEWVDPPAYETSEEEVELDNTIFANPNRDRYVLISVSELHYKN